MVSGAAIPLVSFFTRLARHRYWSQRVALLNVPNLTLSDLHTRHDADYPTWNSDGTLIAAYTAGGDGHVGEQMNVPGLVMHHIVLLRPNGKTVRQITIGYHRPGPIGLSPNGRHVVMIARSQEGMGPVLVLSTQTGKQRRLAVPDNAPNGGKWDVSADYACWLNDDWILFDGSDPVNNSKVSNGFNAIRYGNSNAWTRLGGPMGYSINSKAMRLKNDRFTVILKTETQSELWQGALSPVPRITRKLNSFTTSVVSQTADSMWTLSTDKRTVKRVLLR